VNTSFDAVASHVCAEVIMCSATSCASASPACAAHREPIEADPVRLRQQVASGLIRTAARCWAPSAHMTTVALDSDHPALVCFRIRVRVQMKDTAVRYATLVVIGALSYSAMLQLALAVRLANS
jgi:hypothetical protein